jgi:hypothetical protein
MTETELGTSCTGTSTRLAVTTISFNVGNSSSAEAFLVPAVATNVATEVTMGVTTATTVEAGATTEGCATTGAGETTTGVVAAIELAVGGGTVVGTELTGDATTEGAFAAGAVQLCAHNPEGETAKTINQLSTTRLKN